jgi:hypothetical protein
MEYGRIPDRAYEVTSKKLTINSKLSHKLGQIGLYIVSICLN